MNICPICNSARQEVFRAKILSKHDIKYLFCENCGFLQTEEPYWLEEAYSSAIADTDTGLVARNIHLSKKLTCILYLLFGKEGKYLDIAGGYGLLTRLMRDVGFDFYWSDLYCQNILAKGFDVTSTSKPFSAVTAFEVLEHIYDPINFVKHSLQEAETSTFIFSTELFSGRPPKTNEWWYYSHETGQHISFFQHNTLQFLAKRLSLNVYSHSNFHILTDKTLNPLWWKILTSRLSSLIYIYTKKRLNSKTFQDHEIIKQQGI